MLLVYLSLILFLLRTSFLFASNIGLPLCFGTMPDKKDGLEEAAHRIEEAKRTRTTSLDLGGLALPIIPDSVAQLANLEELTLGNNEISVIPDSLTQLGNLRVLDFRHNEISAIPDSLARLSNLQEVDFSNNQISTIPVSLSRLANLQGLAFNNNQISTFPDALAEIASLWYIRLRGNRFTSIPDCVARFTELRRLDFESNAIGDIPSWLGQLTKLETLFLYKNRITFVPESLAQLSKLKDLGLSGNAIPTIPDWIAKLTNLQYFGMHHNRIMTIPEALTEAVSLRQLSLADNQISQLPDSLGHLENLETLRLANNLIAVIPESIAQLIKMRELDLSHNQITAIPDSFYRIAHIKTLKLTGNPLPDEVLAALKQGIPSFFRYLDSTAKHKVYPRTVKLVLLGEPKSGKTTLLEALKGNLNPCDESRQETLGVNVVTIEKPHPTDHQPMYLSAWDFAGQHIEHATHQFFLTENAIYLILWNARQGAASGKHDLWYWLELLKMRVREPKFVLVATHTEHTPPDLNLSDIETSYVGCQGNFPVELCSLKGVSALEAKILELAGSSPSMRAPWPPEWRDVRDQVRKVRKQQPYMTPKTFNTLMKKKGVSGEEAQKDLAGQLHHLGEILYFQERDELSRLVILNPEWVTELIALVVRSQQVRQHNGILRTADLDQLWSQANLKPGVRDHLIHLMDWFDLTYSTGHKTDQGIVVEALPYSKPEDLKQIELPAGEPQMEMIFRFPSLQRRLPPGIPTWGMARAHRFSKCTPWRDAAAFRDDVTKSQAIILASDARKEVRLRVAADFPPFFFGQLQAILLDTFKRYPGAVPELRFPCPCRPGCPTSYLYETVVKRWRDNKDVYCDLSAEDVSAESLLSGARRRPETAEGRLALQSEIRRQFTAQRHAQNDQMEKNCPSIFTLVPSRDFKQLETWLESITQGEELELALYCEHDSGWHPTAHSLYRFSPDQEWFDLLKKGWNKLVGVTKYVGPLAKAAGKASKAIWLEAAGLGIEKLPEVARSEAVKLTEALGQKEQFEVIDIETRFLLEQLINHLDLQRPATTPKNGGLHRHIIDDGRLLWLCPEHKKLYQPRA